MLSEFRNEVDVDAGEVTEMGGGAPTNIVKDELSRLSETERRIVSLVAVGRTNQEIAERLSLSPESVEWSLTKVYRRLEVCSRTELAATLGSASTPAAASAQIVGGPVRSPTRFQGMEET